MKMKKSYIIWIVIGIVGIVAYLNREKIVAIFTANSGSVETGY